MTSQLPGILSRIPRVALVDSPSPVRPMTALSERLDVSVFVKNDGLLGQSYGGNKVRKLEYLLAAALAQQAQHIVTLGAAGSNHAVATSTYARQLGMRCTVCMVHQPVEPVVTRNLQRHVHLGTQLLMFDSYRQALEHAQQLARCSDTCLIPLGGSSPVAAPGFISAAAELAAQIERSEMPIPARVYVACGTMGTATGLALGFALLQLPIQVVAVRVTRPEVASTALFQKLYADSVAYLQAQDATITVAATPAAHTNLFCEEFFGSAYGVPTPGALAAIKLANVDNLTLDPTYTGKALSALVEHACSGVLKNQTVLFWNTLNAKETPLADMSEHKIPGPGFARYFTN